MISTTSVRLKDILGHMKAKDWLILGVGAVGTYFAFKKGWEWTRKKLPEGGSSTNVPLPPAPPSPPQLMTGSTLPLTPGRRYFATVDVGFPASMGASPSAITDLAAKKGFVNVGVSKGARPAGWPGNASGDYYVSGEYRGQPSSIEREPGGGVTVKEAFVL